MKLPNFKYEKLVWKRGFKYVGGLDEAGRGAFAGPVVCGCVVFDKKDVKKFKKVDVRIDDSKRLTKPQREKAYKWIKENARSWGVGVGTISEINRKKIGKTTASGFRRAVASANNRGGIRIDFLLIDAFYIPYIRGIQMPRKRLKVRRERQKILSQGQELAIIHGDARSFSIAAASIIAKVYRDRLMERLSQKAGYKKYSWEKNKGYGTKKHRDAIKKFGISKMHRKAYIETSFKKKEK